MGNSEHLSHDQVRLARLFSYGELLREIDQNPELTPDDNPELVKNIGLNEQSFEKVFLSSIKDPITYAEKAMTVRGKLRKIEKITTSLERRITVRAQVRQGYEEAVKYLEDFKARLEAAEKMFKSGELSEPLYQAIVTRGRTLEEEVELKSKLLRPRSAAKTIEVPTTVPSGVRAPVGQVPDSGVASEPAKEDGGKIPSSTTSAPEPTKDLAETNPVRAQTAGQAFRKWREYLGLEYPDISEKLGLTHMAVYMFEKAKNPKPETIERYANALGIPPYVLYAKILPLPVGPEPIEVEAAKNEEKDKDTKPVTGELTPPNLVEGLTAAAKAGEETSLAKRVVNSITGRESPYPTPSHDLVRVGEDLASTVTDIESGKAALQALADELGMLVSESTSELELFEMDRETFKNKEVKGKNLTLLEAYVISEVLSQISTNILERLNLHPIPHNLQPEILNKLSKEDRLWIEQLKDRPAEENGQQLKDLFQDGLRKIAMIFAENGFDGICKLQDSSLQELALNIYKEGYAEDFAIDLGRLNVNFTTMAHPNMELPIIIVSYPGYENPLVSEDEADEEVEEIKDPQIPRYLQSAEFALSHILNSRLTERCTVSQAFSVFRGLNISDFEMIEGQKLDNYARQGGKNIFLTCEQLAFAYVCRKCRNLAPDEYTRAKEYIEQRYLELRNEKQEKGSR